MMLLMPGVTFFGACGRWFIATSRVVVNHDGVEGTVLDLWFGLLVLIPRGAGWVHAVRDLAMLRGPPAIRASGWFNIPASAIGVEDVAHWPCSVSLLVKCVALLGSLHWPLGGNDLGVVVCGNPDSL